jgi:pyruvate,water dikinase
MPTFIQPFQTISMNDLPQVGGKNASLGELIQHLTPHGIMIPGGFATTAEAYWQFVEENKLSPPLSELLSQLDRAQFSNLTKVGQQIRTLMQNASLPQDVQQAIREAYRALIAQEGEDISLAVRSSATAEDLPKASFAGQLESYLNVRGIDDLLATCHRCYASLFTDRAIKYREDNGFDHQQVALSVGVQRMVRSDRGCSGVNFTLDPDSGFDQVVLISSVWGLGENIVQGTVNPDEFYVFKPTLKQGKQAIISRQRGSKEQTMIYQEEGTGVLNVPTPPERRQQYTLTDDEVTTLAQWSVTIEEHYGQPMDIEWAKDGLTGQLYVVQARPETVHSSQEDYLEIRTYQLPHQGTVLCQGYGLGHKITAGKAWLLRSPEEVDKLQAGEVLVTTRTTPDWDPILKKASGIITDQGGRTSHAAIVAREVGAVAVIGAGNATQTIRDGQEVTVSCAEGETGYVYDGTLEWQESVIELTDLPLPETQVMFILGDPDQAFRLSAYPNHGVGLMRLEFIINNAIQIHPMALCQFDQVSDPFVRDKIESLTEGYDSKSDYFVEKLSEAVAKIAAAFYPKDVIVRMSDFKSNEYANLVGGRDFEPDEANPMIGFRGASRYYHPKYQAGFELECQAMKRVRETMGLDNVKLMIPFCRSAAEAERVIAIMQQCGLERGKDRLELYMMTEIPSNVILAEEFATHFDGFSIGSNDLTQLVLGVDRDSDLLSDLFCANDPAVKKMIREVITVARRTNTKIGLCGQAPSDNPAFAQFLVEMGIDSISFNPDALLAGIKNVFEAEKKVVGVS